MNREDIESSTESECGGMYSKVARVRREEVICDVQPDVNYRCGTAQASKEKYEDAPIWWQLEVEGRSFNL